MNAYKDWKEGLLTDAEYASLCNEEKIRYEEERNAVWSWNEEDIYEDDEDI